MGLGLARPCDAPEGGQQIPEGTKHVVTRIQLFHPASFSAEHEFNEAPTRDVIDLLKSACYRLAGSALLAPYEPRENPGLDTEIA